MSNPNRKRTEQSIINDVEAILPGGGNGEIYRQLFAKMDDAQFDQFMTDLINEVKRLSLIAPNFSQAKLSVERNLALGKEWGHKFFQRVWVEGDENTPTYLTPIPYLVAEGIVRRQAQLLVKKISIPEDNSSVDDFTGQPTGKSKGSKISYPEIQVLAAMGLDDCLIEMIKYRGGDTKGFLAMNTSISKTGDVSLDGIKHLAGGVEATRTLKTFLMGMHLNNTLMQKA
jgi:hypothetical protein